MKLERRRVVNNEVYEILDWVSPDSTFSITKLNAEKSTRGHKHDNQSEVYYFYVVPQGKVTMIIGEESFSVKPQDVFWVAPGMFHRVINETKFMCEFIACFAGSAQRPEFK